MKKIYLLLAFIFLFSCKNSSPNETKQIIKEAPVAINFDWLIGDWQRTNEEEGKTTFEHWEKINANEYLSLAYTMQNEDTLWRENVSLIKTNDTWIFDVIAKGDSLSTHFIVSEMDSVSFACTNEKNIFPKKISYFKNGTNMRAEISGGDMMIPYEFNKINK